MIEFKLPSLGADMDRGRLLEWKVKPGDEVRRGDVVAVVDTSKAAIEVEIWNAGTVQALLLAPGDDVPVGTPMLSLLAPGEAPATPAAGEVPAGARDLAPAPLASASGAVSPQPDVGRRRVSPAARRRAEELHVDLDRVHGSGPGGAVTIEDVLHARAPIAPPAPAPAAAPTAGERMAAMRQTIAAAMSRSKREIPHYYLAAEVPLERATEWLARTNTERPVTERILLAAVLIKATAVAARRYPEMNGYFRDGRFEASAEVNVGVAISLRQGGLIAPALIDTDKKPIAQVMAELTDLVKRARAFSLRASELSRPTLTLTNLGDQGVDLVQGVIYPPQVALVGFGTPARRAWVEGNSLKLIPVLTASLAADHRVSDGHRGALFLASVRDLLQTPERL